MKLNPLWLWVGHQCMSNLMRRSTPQRRPQPVANPFGFSDYPFGFSDYLPNDYYDHPQPQYKLLGTSHRKEDS
uniref:Uncharacterized protein n=1 Tax=Romanomermis culicivorax TaxID=13658 RepID=A0A915JUE0_ROMCU